MSSSADLDGPAVELRRVARRISDGTGPPRVLFADVDARFDRGTWTTIVGRSGTGKTALLEILGLLRRPDAGEVRVAGRQVDWARSAGVARIRGGSIGFVFQLPALDESATVRENALDGVRLARRAVDGDVSKRLDELARAVGLEPHLDRRVDALSGGEKQRVSVVRAMIKQPLLIVADEPTASLDAAARHQVLDLLHRAVGDGAALVVVTHDPSLLEHSSSCLELSGGCLRPVARG